MILDIHRPTRSNPEMSRPANASPGPNRGAVLLGCAPLILLCGCSVRQYTIDTLADVLSGSETVFASDDDPQLIREALPFSLKLIESLLAETPRHRGLLLAACSGFTQYSFAFVQQEADQLETIDISAAIILWDRSRKLYLRALAYGIRGLNVRHSGFSDQLLQDPTMAVNRTTTDDVGFLYWTACAWGAAMSISKHDPQLLADQPVVEAIIDRTLELDEAFQNGVIHTFLISSEMARRGADSDPVTRARHHFERAVVLSAGQAAAPFVTMAEAICVKQQDRAEFESLLERATSIDPDARPNWRLENLVMQERARWLLSRADELFID